MQLLLFQGYIIYTLAYPLLGKLKGIAFITDPDGYWVEILNGPAVNKLINH